MLHTSGTHGQAIPTHRGGLQETRLIFMAGAEIKCRFLEVWFWCILLDTCKNDIECTIVHVKTALRYSDVTLTVT